MPVTALLFAALLAATLLLVQPAPAAAEAVRGITVSTHRGGQEWGSDAIGPTFAEIAELGAGWVAIHPYARIDEDGSVRFRPIDPAAPPEHVVRPIREAHRLGLKILIKPHLAYWGSPFSWRGEIRFEEEAAWRRFWTGYREWIVALAAVSREADAFAVGTELDQTLDHQEEWRRLIAEVRRVTPAPLTYAANWSHYREVGFWDALDTIGIQAYFPLIEVTGEPAERPATAATAPTADELAAGWRRTMAELAAYSVAQDRHIVFTELGYNRSFAAPHQPWAYRTDGPEAEGVQAACLAAALAAIEGEPRVVGSFLWKWFPQPRQVGRNFQLATPAIRAVIRDAWRGGPAGSLPGAR